MERLSILVGRLNKSSELCKHITHKLYLISNVRKYITTEACITIFKTMILALFEYGDIIYSGTSCENLKKIDKLFYRGLRICTGSQIAYNKFELCNTCKIAPLKHRRHMHLLLFMHRHKEIENLLKKTTINTRLHMAPVFWYYKPNNEKAKQNVMYRGALEWNTLSANDRNLEYTEFKLLQKREIVNIYN